MGISGVAYLALANSVAGIVFLSGPLLLLWITGSGVWLTASGNVRNRAGFQS